MRKVFSIITICFVLIAALAGCSVLQKLGFKKGNDETQPASSVVMNEDEAKKLTDKVPINLYFANEDNSRLKLEVRYIPVSEAKKSVNNLASVIVKELIKGPGAESGLKPTIYGSTALRAPVSISNGVATVDFTKDFIDKHPGGKTAEQLTIYSIVNSLTELKEIEKVKFIINGKQQKDFKGSYKFDAPFPRSVTVIDRSVTPVASPAPDSKSTIKQETGGTKTVSPSPTPQPAKKEAPANTGKGTITSPKPTDGKTTGAVKGTQKSTNTNADSEATYLEILE